MKKIASLPFYGVAALAALISCASSAWAGTITNIPTPYQNSGTLYGPGNWSGNPYNTALANAPTNGNQNTGITFTDWSGHYEEVGPQGSFALSFSPVALGNDSTVNTLLNTFYGIATADPTAVITFENSNGDTVAYDLFGQDTIRDYNQNTFTNDLTGGSVASGVTAENWYTSSTGDGTQRLDVQTFYLPATWAGTELTSISIFDSTGSPGNTGDNPDPDILLSAMQVDSNAVTVAATPEPSSIALLGTGVLGLAGMVRRRIDRNR